MSINVRWYFSSNPATFGPDHLFRHDYEIVAKSELKFQKTIFLFVIPINVSVAELSSVIPSEARRAKSRNLCFSRRGGFALGLNKRFLPA